jgi:hypothetical protein
VQVHDLGDAVLQEAVDEDHVGADRLHPPGEPLHRELPEVDDKFEI